MDVTAPGAAWRRRPDVTLQRVGREAVLHDARLRQAHVVNATAARAWELADGRPFDDLLSEFAATYGRDPATVRADLESILTRFEQLGLVEREPVVA